MKEKHYAVTAKRLSQKSLGSTFQKPETGFLFLFVSNGDKIVKTCHKLKKVSFYRCGGQGDLLSGSLSVFLFWASRNPDCPDPGAGVIAGWAGARIARACAAQAFAQHGRATTTSDLINQLESAFSRLFESETCL